MAKVGEGDSRWIVADLKDGTNVGGWHWTERDVMAWSRSRLGELLAGTSLADTAAAGAQLTRVEELKGEAVVNQRKGKLLATYELELLLAWEGTAAGAPASGRIRLPYISEENHDEDPELVVSVAAESPEAQACRQAILGAGKQVVLKAVHQFVAELRAGGPYAKGAQQPAACQPGTATAGGSTAASGGAQSSVAAVPAPKAAVPAAAPKPKAATPSGDSHSISITERFYCRPDDLYQALTDERRVQAYTQSGATMDLRPGGAFTMFGGSVSGSYVELQPGARIVQLWRFNHWPEGVHSKVTITLEEPEPGTTVLQLSQTGIPAVDKFGHELRDADRAAEEGWRHQILQRIKAVFGYGM